MIFPRVPYPQKDGGAIAMYNLIAGLASCKGVNLHLFFLNTTKHYVAEDIIEREFSQFGKVSSVDIDNNVTVRGAVQNIFSKDSYFISRYIKENVAIELKNILSQESFDVVHVDGLQVANYVEVIKQYKEENTKVVLRQHNVEHLIWERLAEDKSRVKRTYLRWQTKRLKRFELSSIHKFDAVLPISGIDETFFKSEGVPKMHVLPAGVILKETQALTNKGLNVKDFYHLGSMDWQPNCDSLDWFLSEIWPAVYQENPDITFNVAGKSMPDYFYKYDGQLGVTVWGEIKDADEFVQNYGCQIVPLRSGSGLRVKILEAFSKGKVVITTPIGCEGIPVSDKKEVLLAHDKESFVDVISSLKNNVSLATSISNNAYQFVEKEFSIAKVSQRLIEFYSSLLES